MRNRVAMPYVKDKVQAGAMSQFKGAMQRLMKGATAAIVSFYNGRIRSAHQHHSQVQRWARNAAAGRIADT